MFCEFKEPNYSIFISSLENIINKYNKEVERISSIKENEFTKTIKILEDIDEELNIFFTPLSHLNSVMNNDENQKIYEEALPILSAFQTKLSHNNALYEKLKRILANSDEQKRVIDENIKDFKLSGIDLPQKTKERLEEIDSKLSLLSNQFSQNLLNATNSFSLIIENDKDVENIPENILESAKIEKDGKMCYEFTLQMPSYIGYMTYGPNRSLREKLYHAYTTRAPENSKVIDEILSLRDEEAMLLGFNNYASLALEKRDANSAYDVIEFLEKIANIAKNYAKKELDELNSFAFKYDGIQKLESYDVGYYSEKFKKELFDFDETEVQEYFEQDKVLNGLLDIVSNLFDVEFKKMDLNLWHECVKTYDMYENGKLKSRLYFDLEVRKEKRGGAWMHDFETHFIDSKGNIHLSSAFIVCNFMSPNNKTPSLLRHDDVVTLFHEMGHALHHIFSNNEERSISGINGVAWDVVEFPSQFLENFAYKKEILKTFAKHYKTNKNIPEDLLEKIESSKNFQASLGILRQIEFALFDIKLHLKLYNSDEAQILLDEIRKITSLITPPKYNKFQNGFSHIFSGGYAAGYYSYKWAEVLSADAFFECLDDNGNFNKSKAVGYKENILAKGNLNNMRVLYEKWLGKTPNLNNLFKLYGLESA
ncbi:MAG: M3 family metallopeptidase [Sulfurovaceae bacterium]|nr:M3 family metallopeptidase [Sulfurovaceae bacterium]MDD5548214.1 M3 family metallopeptidase [Sulfurovaceae bacterium]